MSLAAPALSREFSLAPQTMGLLLSAFFWTYGLFQLPAGFAIDRLGVKIAYSLAFLLWSIASALISLCHTANQIFSLRLLLGLAEAVGPLASLAFIRQAFSKDERGLPVSIYIAGQTLGPACGALLGTKLLAGLGWRSMFALTGLGALLWLPFWALWGYSPAPVATEEPQDTVPGQPLRWYSIARSPAFLALAFCVFLFSYYWYFLLTWIPTYLSVARHLSTLAMGRMLSSALFAMAPVTIAVGFVCDRLARSFNALRVRTVTAAIGFLGAGTVLLIPITPAGLPVLGVLMLSVCCFGAGSTNFWAIVQHISPGSRTARIVAIFNTISQVAGAAAPIVTGYTLGAANNFSLAITLAGLSTIAASFLILSTGVIRLERLSLNFQSLTSR